MKCFVKMLMFFVAVVSIEPCVYAHSDSVVSYHRIFRYNAPEAPSKTRNNLRVGFITLGRTPMAELQKQLGEGMQEIGVHPGSAREWRLTTGGCLKADGDILDTANYAIVTQLLWYSGKCESHRDTTSHLTFRGIHLGTLLTTAKHIMGAHYRIVSAYNRSCYCWRIPGTPHKDAVTVLASFKNQRLTLLSIMLGSF